MESIKHTSFEIRNLMMDTLVSEDSEIDKSGNTFPQHDFQGTQSDLFRLMEGLAIKRKYISDKIEPSKAAWATMGFSLCPNSTTNFSHQDILQIYENFYILLNQGIIAPGMINGSANLPYFHVTEYGKKCLKEKDILPYDADGYMLKIKTIPNINEWVMFYIEEALQCFNTNCMEAAIIMLGLSSEKIILELCQSIELFINNNYPNDHQTEIKNMKSKLKISEKLTEYNSIFNDIKKKLKGDPVFIKILQENDKLSQECFQNLVRVLRNDLAHPSDTKMERIDVLMIFLAYIQYCKVQYDLINYYNGH